MIAFNRRIKNIYPARLLLFCDDPQEAARLRPWEVAWLRQASERVKEACQRQCLASTPFHTAFTDLTQPLEEIRAKIEKGTLYEIRRAEGLPLQVQVNGLPVDKLFSVLSRFYGSKGLPCPKREAFGTFMEKSDAVVGLLNGKFAVCHVLMKDMPSRVRLMYSFHDVEAEISSQERGFANRYLHWWELQHYKEAGAANYDWGGIVLDPDSPAYGISKFKLSFGGEQREEWHMLAGGSLVRLVWKTRMLDRLVPDEFRQESL